MYIQEKVERLNARHAALLARELLHSSLHGIGTSIKDNFLPIEKEIGMNRQ
jgi:hypothetical protein